MLKERGINFDKNGYEIKSSEIPEDIEVKAKLDVILPQEKLQLVNVGLQMQKLGMPDEYIQSNLLGITNTKEIASQFVKQQAANSLVQYKLQQKVQRLQQSDQQEEQLRNEQLQNAITAARNAAAGGAAGQPAAPEAPAAEPEMGMTQGQQIEAQLMSNAMQPPMPEAGGQMPMPEAGGPMPMPVEGMEGGLPGAMGGMIPGQGMAGTPDESGLMR